MLFRYPGGKSKFLPALRPFIYPLVEKYGRFTDAFVGGGSVLLDIAQHFPKVQLLANDLNENIAGFWRYISTESNISPLLALIEQPVTIDLFYSLRETTPLCLVNKAYHAIFFNRTTFSGIEMASPIGGKKQESKWLVNCRYNAKKLKEDLETTHKLLYGRLIVTESPVEACSDFGPSTYYDPPYYVKGKMLYRHFMTADQHGVLAAKLKASTDWVASYDNCREIQDLYSWANLEVIDARYSINGKKASWCNKKEVIIYRYS